MVDEDITTESNEEYQKDTEESSEEEEAEELEADLDPEDLGGMEDIEQ